MTSKTTKNATTTKGAWKFENSYVHLPESFYIRQNPVPVREPKIAVFNPVLAEFLGLNSKLLNGSDRALIFSGNKIPEGAEPIAQAYAGHQFGHFTMLGDGRAILLGEQITPDGNRFDIQLKGSGRTPFSRGGDGRAALGPMLREYIVSEALYGLGIPTTRSLAVVTTGESVFRDTPLPGAILTRVASSHIRIGTFEYVSARGNPEEIRTLADYTIQRHYPELREADNPYLAFLHAVMERQASLLAKWQLVGFIHGVMNTDNMALSGETIDFGPCAFMDTYDPATVFSSIDLQGRYAYGNQPGIAQWNLARLAETLLPLFHPDEEKALTLGEDAISAFPELYTRYWLLGMRSKLGLVTEEEEDTSLIADLLTWMHRNQQDFTNTFRALCSEILEDNPLFQLAGFSEWHTQWRSRLERQPASLDTVLQLMQTHNPAVIPRNHKVEDALAAAVDRGDYSVMQRLLEVLEAPYSDTPEKADYRLPPEPSGIPYKTFCGT